MAYADKITTMRRFAIIASGGGAIIAEGVDIEGALVYKLAGEDEVFSSTLYDIGMFLKEKDARFIYQDPEDENYWEPRTFDPLSVYYEGKDYEIPGFSKLQDKLDELTIRSGE